MNNKHITQTGLLLTDNAGGATILRDGSEATKGFAVGGVLEFTYPMELERKKLEAFVEEAISCIQETDANAFGFWCNSGTLYIDAVTIFDNEADAIAFGRKNNELAIYHINGQKQIDC